MDFSEAKSELKKINPENKFTAMLKVAAIITKVLGTKNIKPVIVGGLSVEIYTQSDYTTRDIDFVTPGYEIIEETLKRLDFIKENRHFYRDDIEISIEIPDSYLAGDRNRVVQVWISKDSDDFVYVISLEDIILDRLRAATAWQSSEDLKWGFLLLSANTEKVDVPYLFDHTETDDEREELKYWLNSIKNQTKMDFSHRKY
ncbi:MAG: nucleotidyltransferase [Sporolactobacillus sp.]